MRLNDDALAATELSIIQRPGYDSTDSVQRKGAIDKQARFPEVALGLQGRELGRKSVPQILSSFARANRSWNNPRMRKGGIAQLLPDLRANIVDPSQIAFRQGDQSASYTQISQNLQMFFGLWHPTVICCDNEKGEID